MITTFLAFVAMLPQGTDVPGISRALATDRKTRVSGVRYELAFELTKGMAEVAGRATVTFKLMNAERDLLLDFAGDAIDDVVLNGDRLTDTDLARVHDHVLLPKTSLVGGDNTFVARVRARVAATGTPLTVYRDPSNGAEYLYTLLVPADAHRLFPCFDQPDLKATFALTLTTPHDWQAIANGAEAGTAIDAEKQTTTRSFATTKPLPTYLFAFAAGPFLVVDGPKDESPPLRVFVRPGKRAQFEADAVLRLHRESLAWLAQEFGAAYPFGKLDLVLVPGFPYGGMEHAGAIFYRETALCFDHPPTEGERHRRSTLVYHEVSHQWFGNLVTMAWFDDLWLKEGFATFTAYKALDALEPGSKAWLRFHQLVKPAAYRVDVTAGTVPIWQELGNLDDAKSAYGPIVYNKAPAVLRELEARVTPEKFRAGVRAFLSAHAFGNATWQSLLAAIETASGQTLAEWSRRWILAAGMPRVCVHMRGLDRRDVVLRQESTLGDGGVWPISFVVAEVGGSGRTTSKVVMDAAEQVFERRTWHELTAPWLLLNAEDTAYGQFLLDADSAHIVADLLAKESGAASGPAARQPWQSQAEREFVFSALTETMREGGFTPAAFAATCHAILGWQRDAITHAFILGTLTTTLDRYLPEDLVAPQRAMTETMLRTQLAEGRLAGLELDALRGLVRLARDPASIELFTGLLTGKATVPGLVLGQEDRFLLIGALLAARHEKADALLATEIAAAKGDVAKWAWQAQAARPDAAAKARYFSAYLDEKEPPEQWVIDSLPFFLWPGQEKLTASYLEPALAKVEWVKAHRKIFFMPAWIDAFINAQSSPAALATVEAFLARKDLAVDIRRKVLQSVDGLRRAVKLRDAAK